MEHSIPFASKTLSKYCWAFEKLDNAKKAIDLSFNCVGITFPRKEASNNIFWVLSESLLNKCDDFSWDAD